MTKFWAIAFLFAVTACGGSKIPAPPGQKIGKPYSVGWKTYYPEYDPTYDKTGVASWYGPGFHGKSTATGETFDTHDLTAAHPTLPMPSLVRVTNLENGKSAVVRVNDRGPFKSDRIIDLSKASAQRLGVVGLSKVRVQYLKQETDEYLASREQGKDIDMVAYNDQLENRKYASILASTIPSDGGQIVEASDGSSSIDSPVTSAAPMMSVDSADLPNPKQQEQGFGVIHEAWADESQPAPKSVESHELKAPVNKTSKEVVLKPMQELKETEPPPAQVSVAGQYFIQAGSFSTQENANKLSRKLGDVANVAVGQIDMNGRQWWRVRVGPFVDHESAELALNQVQNTVPDARIMRQ